MSELRPVVSTDWLAEHLDDPDLRVLDATVLLTLDPGGGPPTIEGGEPGWAAGHIPGAAFADLAALSDPEHPERFNLPTPEAFADEISRLGVGPESTVVVYDRKNNEWAARLWWMLRAFGHDRVAVLDGGWTAWTAEGRPVSAEPAPTREPTTFVPRFRPEMVASLEEVAAFSAEGGACLINSLPAPLHSGEVPIAYGRAGRIPGSVNVSARGLVDPETNLLLPVQSLRAHFEAAGALGAGKIVTYCGGAIDASLDALMLALLGREDVAVYDGSLVEWAEDPERPLEAG